MGWQPKICSNCENYDICKDKKKDSKLSCKKYVRKPLTPPKAESVVQKPTVIYICDKKACVNCKDEGFCTHTSQIEHAENFKKENEIYVEQEATSGILVDLMREVSRLKKWRFENCKHKNDSCIDIEQCNHCKYTR